MNVPEQSASAPGSTTHGLTPSPPNNAGTNNNNTHSGSNGNNGPDATLSAGPGSVPPLSADSNTLSFSTSTDLMTDSSDFMNTDLDFANLVSMGDGFDFGLYLSELGDDTGDNGEVGMVP